MKKINWFFLQFFKAKLSWGLSTKHFAMEKFGENLKFFFVLLFHLSYQRTLLLHLTKKYPIKLFN